MTKWLQLDERLLCETKFFDLRVKRLQPPGAGPEDDYFFITTVDWANVIALTPESEVVLVKQYRHAVDSYSLEIPGGMLGPGEDPRSGAVRELQEETGYVAGRCHALGRVHPNPALMTNSCFFFFAPDVRLEASQALDPEEDLTVHLLPLAEIPAAIAAGRITHSLTICSFFLLTSFFKDGAVF